MRKTAKNQQHTSFEIFGFGNFSIFRLFAGFKPRDPEIRIIRKISVPNAPFSRPPAPPPAPTVVRKILNPTFGKSRGALFNFSIFRGFSGSGTFPGGFFGKFQYRTPRFRGVSSHPLPQRWYANFQPSFFAKSTTQGGGSPPPRTPPFRRPPAGDKSLRFCRGGAAPPNPHMGLGGSTSTRGSKNKTSHVVVYF